MIEGKILEIDYWDREGYKNHQRVIKAHDGRLYPINVEEAFTIEIPKGKILSEKEVGEIRWKRKR